MQRTDIAIKGKNARIYWSLLSHQQANYLGSFLGRGAFCPVIVFKVRIIYQKLGYIATLCGMAKKIYTCFTGTRKF
ncbi:hypothetical protein SLA2020_023720 [Shorea laevis]